MKKALLLVAICFVSFSCHKYEAEPGCTVLATVTDLSKTAGCGFGFKLEDGSILVAEPHNNKCGHQDPLLNFQLSDNLKVKIGYEMEHHHPSPCTAGTSVEITCITLVPDPEKGV